MKSNTTVARWGHKAMFCPTSQHFSTPVAAVSHFPMPWAMRKAMKDRFSMPWAMPKAREGHFSVPWAMRKAMEGHFSVPWAMRKAMKGRFSMPWAMPKAVVILLRSTRNSLERRTQYHFLIRPPNFAHHVLAVYGELLSINTRKMIV